MALKAMWSGVLEINTLFKGACFNMQGKRAVPR